MKNQTSFKTETLAPGREVTVKITGSFFFIDSVNGSVSVKFDAGPFVKMISGSEIECPPGDYFTEITFRSDIGAGGVTLVVSYYAGTLKMGNRFPTVFTRPVPTYDVVSEQTILIGASYTIPTTNLRTGQTVPDRLVRVRLEATAASGANGELRTLANSPWGELPRNFAATGVDGVREFETREGFIIHSPTGTVITWIKASYELPN